MFEQVIFYTFAAGLLFSALMVITLRNPVHAALFLVAGFFASAGAHRRPGKRVADDDASRDQGENRPGGEFGPDLAVVFALWHGTQAEDERVDLGARSCPPPRRGGRRGVTTW